MKVWHLFFSIRIGSSLDTIRAAALSTIAIPVLGLSLASCADRDESAVESCRQLSMAEFSTSEESALQIPDDANSHELDVEDLRHSLRFISETQDGPFVSHVIAGETSGMSLEEWQSMNRDYFETAWRICIRFDDEAMPPLDSPEFSEALNRLNALSSEWPTRS